MELFCTLILQHQESQIPVTSSAFTSDGGNNCLFKSFFKRSLSSLDFIPRLQQLWLQRKRFLRQPLCAKTPVWAKGNRYRALAWNGLRNGKNYWEKRSLQLFFAVLLMPVGSQLTQYVLWFLFLQQDMSSACLPRSKESCQPCVKQRTGLKYPVSF